MGPAVERAGAAVVGAGALELDLLPDDPDQVRGLTHLLDQIVRDHTHAVNSTIVTPWPPWLAGAKPKRCTRGSAARTSCTRSRTAPVPLPWMTRRYGRSARTASSSALTSRASASSTRSPRVELRRILAQRRVARGQLLGPRLELAGARFHRREQRVEGALGIRHGSLRHVEDVGRDPEPARDGEPV